MVHTRQAILFRTIINSQLICLKRYFKILILLFILILTICVYILPTVSTVDMKKHVSSQDVYWSVMLFASAEMPSICQDSLVIELATSRTGSNDSDYIINNSEEWWPINNGKWNWMLYSNTKVTSILTS